MSKTAWCEANDINPKKLYYWQRKARTSLLPHVLSSTQVPSKTTIFTPVPLTSLHKSDDSVATFTLDVVLKSNGITKEISNTASTELLSTIGGILCAK